MCDHRGPSVKNAGNVDILCGRHSQLSWTVSTASDVDITEWSDHVVRVRHNQKEAETGRGAARTIELVVMFIE